MQPPTMLGKQILEMPFLVSGGTAGLANNAVVTTYQATVGVMPYRVVTLDPAVAGVAEGSSLGRVMYPTAGGVTADQASIGVVVGPINSLDATTGQPLAAIGTGKSCNVRVEGIVPVAVALSSAVLAGQLVSNNTGAFATYGGGGMVVAESNPTDTHHILGASWTWVAAHATVIRYALVHIKPWTV